jgi:hypothetical protein
MKISFASTRNYPPGKRLAYRLAILLCYAAALVILSLAIYAGIVLYIKNIGIKIVPSRNYPVLVEQYDLQNDPRWSDDVIGSSSLQMGGSGCLITSVSTSIVNLGIDMNPKELNRLLSQNDGYQGADLLWYKINESVPAVDYEYRRIFTSQTIEKDLAAGLMPIVNVKYHETGYTHWVLIVGAKDGDFLIFDPLGDGISPMRLSEHGNVYAYRVIKLAS